MVLKSVYDAYICPGAEVLVFGNVLKVYTVNFQFRPLLALCHFAHVLSRNSNFSNGTHPAPISMVGLS